MRALIRRAVGLCWCLALAPSRGRGRRRGRRRDGARRRPPARRVCEGGQPRHAGGGEGRQRDEGRFDLGEVAAGRYRLVAELDGFEPHAVDLDVGDGQLR